ncbi:MAG: type II secretion system protein GspK [Alphaproteobacteria bacterium]|nr:type II secretion system protein GspK [Alphaproteobacteria bacterium]
MRRLPPRAEQGIALVTVLWAVVLLSVVAGSFTSTTRTEVKIARNAIEGAKAEALADAGVHRAVALLQATLPDDRWLAASVAHGLRLGDGQVRITLQDERGKIDLNAAPDALLTGLFLSLGLEERQAAAMTDAIVDYRDVDDLRRAQGAEIGDYRAAGLPYGPQNAAFRWGAQLRRVLGMTPELYARVAPAVTVYSGEDLVNPLTAPAAVLRALPGPDAADVDDFLQARQAYVDARSSADRPAGDVDTAPLAEAEGYFEPELDSNVFTIRAEARTGTGAVFVREAVVDIEVLEDRPFGIFAWRQGRPTEQPSAATR